MVLVSLTTVLGVYQLSNRFVVPPPLSANDLYLRWTVFPGEYFISDRDYKGKGVLMKTNLELSELDNGVDRFLKKKTPRTFRIFCVGGSTTRGWPFHERLSYPYLLSLELKDVLPNRKIEVVNAGISATDSFSDVFLVGQIIRYSPDLILVYEGRNEATNIALHAGWRSQLLPFHVWLLRNFYLYRCMRYFSGGVSNFDHAQAERHWTDKGFNGEEKKMAILGLQENLQQIFLETRKHSCATPHARQYWWLHCVPHRLKSSLENNA